MAEELGVEAAHRQEEATRSFPTPVSPILSVCLTFLTFVFLFQLGDSINNIGRLELPKNFAVEPAHLTKATGPL